MPKLAGYIKIALLVLLIAFTNSARANDLGRLGKVYPIIEEDLIVVIQRRLAKMEKSGELEKKYKEGSENVKKYLERPPGISLPRAQEYKAKTYDPTYTLPYDVFDIEGKIIYKAGITVNPLDYQPMIEQLCFVNGDDADQVKWLLKYCKDPALSVPVLVQGNLMDLMRKSKVRLYFDQSGWYVKRLQIEALPTVVRQSGRVLYVEQFPIDENGEIKATGAPGGK